MPTYAPTTLSRPTYSPTSLSGPTYSPTSVPKIPDDAAPTTAPTKAPTKAPSAVSTVSVISTLTFSNLVAGANQDAFVAATEAAIVEVITEGLGPAAGKIAVRLLTVDGAPVVARRGKGAKRAKGSARGKAAKRTKTSKAAKGAGPGALSAATSVLAFEILQTVGSGGGGGDEDQRREDVANALDLGALKAELETAALREEFGDFTLGKVESAVGGGEVIAETASPTLGAAPTAKPTTSPTEALTKKPTEEPTGAPSKKPTVVPGDPRPGKGKRGKTAKDAKSAKSAKAAKSAKSAKSASGKADKASDKAGKAHV